jgi:type I restriction enzyme, S subunit
MSELPAGWSYVRLGQLLHAIEAGLNVKCEERAPVGNEAGLVKISAVTWGRFDEQQSKTLPLEMQPDERNRIHTGDLLISRANTIELVGACVIVGEIQKRLYLSDKVLRLRVHEPSKRWINYALKTPQMRKAIQSSSTGNQLSMRNIPQDKLRALVIPLAPEPEQQRIANQLDTLLARVQACNDRFDAIPALLKRFRQAVLDDCLLEDQSTVSVEPGVQPWVLRTVGSLCTSLSDGPFGSNLKSADYTSEGVQVVRLENIGHLFFDAKKETFISTDKYKSLSKHTLSKGDLLFSSFVDEEVRVCEFPNSNLTINKADCFRLRVDEIQCNRHFLLYRLACKSTYQSLKEQVHGATRPRINLTQLRGYEILLPPLAKQAEIVHRVESLFAMADRIEAGCTAARAQAQRLTPLVLAKAFRGELAPQDPSDEPASALLARIGQAITAADKPEKKAPIGRRQATQSAVSAWARSMS